MCSGHEYKCLYCKIRVSSLWGNMSCTECLYMLVSRYLCWVTRFFLQTICGISYKGRVTFDLNAWGIISHTHQSDRYSVFVSLWRMTRSCSAHTMELQTKFSPQLRIERGSRELWMRWASFLRYERKKIPSSSFLFDWETEPWILSWTLLSTINWEYPLFANAWWSQPNSAWQNSDWKVF